MRRIINAVIVATCLLISSCGIKEIKPSPITYRYSIPFIIDNDPPIALYHPSIIRNADINCLAKGIYYEASGEPQKGKEAVGLVIMNRTMDKKYPSKICDVIKQKTVVNNKTFCQFSWYCQNGEAKLHQKIYNPSYDICVAIAKAIINGNLDNWLPQAVSFHVSRINPNWKDHGLIRVAQIGNHIFYRNKNI